MVGRLGKGKFYSEKQRRKVMHAVAKDHRNKHAKETDDGIKASVVHPLTDEGLKAWRKHKNRSDLRRVDD